MIARFEYDRPQQPAHRIATAISAKTPLVTASPAIRPRGLFTISRGVFTIAGLLAALFCSVMENTAVAQPANIGEPARDGEVLVSEVPRFKRTAIPEFSLVNQDGKAVTRSDLLGKKWLAAFIFTKCTGPCPMVSGKMKQLQKQLADTDVQFVSFSVDPERDTPEELAGYAAGLQADTSRWSFLCGERDQLYSLIQNGFFERVEQATGENRQPGAEVLHSTRLCLVDAEGYLVGKYGTQDDGAELARLRRILQGKRVPPASALDVFGDSNAAADSAGQDTADAEPDGTATGDAATDDAAKTGKSADGSVAIPGTTLRLVPTSSTAESEGNGKSSADKSAGGGAIDGPNNVPEWVLRLPALNALLNGTATLLLVSGYVLIKLGNREAHKAAMMSAFSTSILFLTSYLIYHSFVLSRKFAGEGLIRFVYYPMLLTHVILAAAVPVLAILTIYYGLKGRWSAHKRLARWTFPIWLYVSITGVLIYFMLYVWFPGPGPAAS